MDIDFGKLLSGDSVDTIIDPRKLFSALPKKSNKYSYLRDVQSDVLDSWFTRRNEQDLVIKMNTGGGKTVVGLLMLKACLNEKISPVVYIAPDHFLASQVINEANQLGISVTDSYSSVGFKRGESILVIPIHTLINGKSNFGVGSEGVRIRIGSLLIVSVNRSTSG
jgi:superfamily II DNA or RNA helicase